MPQVLADVLLPPACARSTSSPSSSARTFLHELDPKGAYVHPVLHVHHFTEPTLRRTLRAAGWVIDEFDTQIERTLSLVAVLAYRPAKKRRFWWLRPTSSQLVPPEPPARDRQDPRRTDDLHDESCREQETEVRHDSREVEASASVVRERQTQHRDEASPRARFPAPEKDEEHGSHDPHSVHTAEPTKDTVRGNANRELLQGRPRVDQAPRPQSEVVLDDAVMEPVVRYD